MAIQITNQPVNPPYNAYNNSVIEFGVDVGVPVSAKITAGGYTISPLYPDLSGNFYYNLKELVKNLINQDHFADSILVSDPAVYLFEDGNLFLDFQFTVEVTLEDNTTQNTTLTYPFLKSVEQVIRSRYTNSELKLLSPGATDVVHLSYFEGHPFDISVYSDLARTVTVTSKRTGMNLNLSMVKGVNRIFISNGENDNLGFENDLPLHLGINELEFKTGTTLHFTLFLHKVEAECGKLLKWLNPSGGWSYWRFQELHQQSIKSDSIGHLSKDTRNLHEIDGNISVTGKQTEEELKLNSGPTEEYDQIRSVVSSPKVYLYTNELHQPFGKNDFVEVEILNGTYSTTNKSKLKELSLKVALPKQYAQTL